MCDNLSEWVHRQGFPQPRRSGHSSGRVRERIVGGAINFDGKVSILEGLFVQAQNKRVHVG